jgi:outer membrane receptor protein involved in Fe transport
MDHIFRKSVRLMTILFFFLSYSISSAGTTGKLVGIVLDKSTGEPLPGVNILIENTVLGAATDLDGSFLVLGIPPGKYTIRATMIGYTDLVQNDVVINVDKTTKLEFKLSVTSLDLGETIEVTAERPLVKKDLTSTESTVGRDVIENLPVDDFNDVVNLQAGVVDGHFRGGRTGEVAYMINGIPVNDVYSGDIVVEVENNSVQELNVISGTFNAEYGQAMSGVVNIVTKEGSKNYNGNIKAYAGDYLSTGSHDSIFWNIDKYNPIYDIQSNFSGPIPGFRNKLTFFASARIFHDEGFIYGKKVFLPSDISNWVPDIPTDRVIQSRGVNYPFSESTAQQLINNAEAVPMNGSDRYTGNLKLTYGLSVRDKISVETMLQRRNWQDYAHEFRLNPEGNYQQKQSSITLGSSWNHIFSQRTFVDLRYSYFYTRYNQYVYEDPFDPRYVSDDFLLVSGANAFKSGGQQMWNFDRSTSTNLAKLDLVSQITNTHQIKIGVEAKQHRLWMHEFYVIPQLPDRMAPITTIANNQYLHKPSEMSSYIQDKIELTYMVVNAGVRIDYFEPDGVIPTDFTRPTTSNKIKADPKWQVSPRFGIAYPITEKGVIHVSYGHFFQIPNFEYLYKNPEFEVYPLQSIPSDPPQSTLNTMGNADLKPQETVIYEIGLQQQLSNIFGLSVTTYYKDIRNLLGTEVHKTYQGDRYARYINRDYAFVRGITFEFEKRQSSGIGASIDYTYQIAKGNASDPNTAFLDAQSDPPKETEKQLVPLDWDRRHQINATLTLGTPGNYMVSLIGRFGTGLPYTPTFQNIQTAVENSGRRPDVFYTDLYAYKNVTLFKMEFGLYLKIYNLFDRLNETDVFRDTGHAGYTLEPLYVGGLRPRGINTLNQYFVRPDYYSEPRRIQIGFEVGF